MKYKPTTEETLSPTQVVNSLLKKKTILTHNHKFTDLMKIQKLNNSIGHIHTGIQHV